MSYRLSLALDAMSLYELGMVPAVGEYRAAYSQHFEVYDSLRNSKYGGILEY